MHKSIKSLLAISALALAGAASAGAASAATIYSNGPINGTLDAFFIDQGTAVEDSFTVSSATTATGADFTLWTDSGAGKAVATVDWAIESAQTYADNATATVTSTFLFTNSYGFDVYSSHISFAGIALTPGTYYFSLGNAVAQDGNPNDNFGWDQNDGPSAAFQTGFGNLAALATDGSGFPCNAPCTYSEAFDITSSGTPEPATWALMLIGFGGMGAAMRSRRRVLAAAA